MLHVFLSYFFLVFSMFCHLTALYALPILTALFQKSLVKAKRYFNVIVTVTVTD